MYYFCHPNQLFIFFAKNAPALALKLARKHSSYAWSVSGAFAAFAMRHERTHMPEKDKYYSEH
jgi:hypothetical protein